MMSEEHVHVIAEAGVNHNGDPELAFALVDAAQQAGADTIKFQTFDAGSLATGAASKAAYQNVTTDPGESQLDMLRRLQLSSAVQRELVEYCSSRQIQFLSAAFDHESLRFLVDELGLRRLKVPSGELTNSPLLLEFARSGAELIVSTGMANLGEVEQALGVIAFGMMDSDASPQGAADFANAYRSRDGQALLRQKLTLLHCTTQYPTLPEDTNLRAIDILRSAFRVRVGFSDHSEGTAIPIAAAARGASVLEKHFTLDRNLPGPDHKSSLEPEELTEMVTGIRAVEQALDGGPKFPGLVELPNIGVARKCLVAARPIKKGARLVPEDLTAKRAGHGIPPTAYWDMLGSVAKRDYREDDIIEQN